MRNKLAVWIWPCKKETTHISCQIYVTVFILNHWVIWITQFSYLIRTNIFFSANMNKLLNICDLDETGKYTLLSRSMNAFKLERFRVSFSLDISISFKWLTFTLHCHSYFGWWERSGKTRFKSTGNVVENILQRYVNTEGNANPKIRCFTELRWIDFCNVASVTVSCVLCCYVCYFSFRIHICMVCNLIKQIRHLLYITAIYSPENRIPCVSADLLQYVYVMSWVRGAITVGVENELKEKNFVVNLCA